MSCKPKSIGSLVLRRRLLPAAIVDPLVITPRVRSLSESLCVFVRSRWLCGEFFQSIFHHRCTENDHRGIESCVFQKMPEEIVSATAYRDYEKTALHSARFFALLLVRRIESARSACNDAARLFPHRRRKAGSVQH